MQIAFLILNYKNADETIKCVNSIEKLNIEDYMIVIVDNGSKDGSVEKLTELYGKEGWIKIISLEENVGFSKGNNAGYEFIRANFEPEYIVVTNNDVLFPQEDLYNRLREIYVKTKFYILGPDVFVRANSEHQSPIMLRVPTLEEMKKELQMYEYYAENPQKWAQRRRWATVKNRICQNNHVINFLYNKIRKKEGIDSLKAYENVCVQGACIIVSKDYLRAEEKMFTPEPFLYCEELLLYMKCLKKNYKIIYDPSVQIYHEDSATMKKINANDIKRAEFTLKHHVLARKMVIQYMELEN